MDADKMQFDDFLQDLIKGRYLEGAALGITKLVISQGRESLVGKQDFIFQKFVLDEYAHERCAVCNQKIPWCEMFHAINNGLCAACIQK
jgi:hypothetical protein